MPGLHIELNERSDDGLADSYHFQSGSRVNNI